MKQMRSQSALNFPRILPRLAGIVLGSVFIWAGMVKIANPAGFTTAIGNYRLLPAAMIPTIAVTLPWVELGCGTFLVMGRRSAAAALTANILLVIFIFGLTANMVRGIDVNCGCFSLTAKSPASVAVDIVRDAVLLAMGLGVLWAEWKKPVPVMRKTS